MNEATEPRGRASRNRREHQEPGWVSRPDRAALWAFLLAIFVMVFAAVSGARAAESGGVGGSSPPPAVPVGPVDSDETPIPSEPEGSAACPAADFGERVLDLGDCGDDVKTLNWVLRAREAQVLPASQTPLGLGIRFGSSTDRAVRTLQSDGGLTPDGVVDADTRGVIKQTMRKSIATWYGPGMWGNQTACGVTLKPTTMGVAHRTLPCGTKVTVAYGGEFERVRVIDRGPYANNADWDLTLAASDALGFTPAGVDKIRAAPIR